MAIPDLHLPTNFGLEDLYEPSNNNASFVLEHGERFGASSLMLGYHSPVLKNNYIKAGILDIDAIEFARVAVKSVVEAMYCGVLVITKENFRDVIKMCHVFDITWMSGKCQQYFEQACQVPEANDSGKDIMFGLFEEAVYFSENGQSRSLLQIFKDFSDQKGNVGKEIFNDFVKKYFRTKTHVPTATLETLIHLADDHSIFLDTIRSKISGPLPILDNVTRFLLLNINMVECFDVHATVITEIFDILLDNQESSDWALFNNLYRRVTKEYLLKNSEDKIACSKPKYLNFPNLFHDRWQVDWSARVMMGESKISETIEKVGSLSCNIYMVLEWLDDEVYENTDGILAKLIELRRERGWAHVYPGFIDTLHFDVDTKNMLKNCTDLTSNGESFCLDSEEEMTDWNFITQSAVYKFYIKEQQLPEQNYNSGFLIETTGISIEEIPEVFEFDVKLVLDKDKYPKDLQFPENVCTNTIHIVLETYFEGTWNNQGIGWRDRPTFGIDDDNEGSLRHWMEWGEEYRGYEYFYKRDHQYPTRLRIYYNLLRKGDENK